MQHTSSAPPDNPARGYLARQLGIAWQLTSYHLQGLATEECLWRPAERGLHVHRGTAGVWQADWPEEESYSLGPSSIGWLTWHLGFWWSMALDHNFGSGTLVREEVHWPGEADGMRAWISGLHDRWSDQLSRTTDAELASGDHVCWPFSGRPLGDLFAWANVELTKSAAEIGYARFLYAARRSE